MLGLPLFLLAVFFTAVRFLGHDPFMGTTEATTKLGFFTQIESYITAPALYGMWVAFGLWAIISIVHIILSKTVKNQRVRAFAVIATCLVVMLVTGFVMDAVFEAKIENIAADALAQYGEGVTVADYKTQLSYYRHLTSSSASKSETLKLIEQVNLLKNAYNVEMEGINKGGVSGNIANKPVTYATVIYEDPDTKKCEVGVDIGFKLDAKTGGYVLNVSDDGKNIISGGDGKIGKEEEQIIRLAPNENGELVINGKVYSHYWYKMKNYKIYDDESNSGVATPIYVWYNKDMMPTGTVYENGTVVDTETTDGRYGTALYNQNGQISDGWVFSLDNVLNILADYYEAQKIVENDDNEAAVQKAMQDAIALKKDYYTNYASDYEKALYSQETYYENRFQLTTGRLDELIAAVGALLGDNHLFDLLLKPSQSGDSMAIEDVVNGILSEDAISSILSVAGINKDSIADKLSPILKSLATGLPLGAPSETIRKMFSVPSDRVINDMFLVLAYKNDSYDHLYVALITDDGTGNKDDNGKYIPSTDWSKKVSEGGNVLLDVDFDDVLIKEADEDGNPEYVFDIDHLNDFLNKLIDSLLLPADGKKKKELVFDLFDSVLNGTVQTIVNLVGGLVGDIKINDVTVDGVNYKELSIGGTAIRLVEYWDTGKKDEEDNSTLYEAHACLDISSLLLNLVEGLYYYQSPVIKPWWEFVSTTNNGVVDNVKVAVQKYYRAEYAGKTYGSMIGSALIGDTLGSGTYPAALGLTSLDAVRQLQVDLSYKPEMYPLFGVRDMIMFFTGFVVLFYYLSFVCAEKEREYATGKAIAEDRKKRVKKNKKKDEIAPLDDVMPEQETPIEQTEDAALPVDENTQKEVL